MITDKQIADARQTVDTLRDRTHSADARLMGAVRHLLRFHPTDPVTCVAREHAECVAAGDVYREAVDAHCALVTARNAALKVAA